jgi:hypothetical protein
MFMVFICASLMIHMKGFCSLRGIEMEKATSSVSKDEIAANLRQLKGKLIVSINMGKDSCKLLLISFIEQAEQGWFCNGNGSRHDLSAGQCGC